MRPNVEALVNARVLCDEGLITDRVVLVEAGRIVAVVSTDDPRVAGVSHRDMNGNMLLPGFIDVQVNGGGGVMFNDDPSVETIRSIAKSHRRFGTTSLLPTFISDDLDNVARAIAAVREAITNKVPGIIGVHIEGPFLNEARKGTHDASKFRSLDHNAVTLLSSLKIGKTLVTLAPEMTTPEIIASLVAQGVVVSAGHTNATFDVIESALRHGLTGFTHLFNAMSPLGSREVMALVRSRGMPVDRVVGAHAGIVPWADVVSAAAR